MKTLPIIPLLACTSLLCGCFTAMEDISKSNVYHTDYAVGKVYKTEESLLLQRLGKMEVLVVPGDSDARIPRSIETYLSQRESWPKILGVLGRGTSMRITRLIREYNGEIGSVFLVFAEILDGAYRGHEVDLRAVSLDHQQKDPVVRVPVWNPTLLEEVE